MAKASDILDDQSNSTGYLKTTDLDNFFYIHLDDKYRYMYNLNAALYLNTGSSSLKTFICDAGFTLIVGFIIDKIGTRLGLAASLIVWSIAGFFSAAAGKSNIKQN
jgi:hypothetical protein